MKSMKGMLKRFSVTMLVITLLFSVMLPMNFTFAEDTKEGVKITIVHTNDTHGRVKEGKYDGMGFAKLSTKVQEVKESNSNVLVLDAGDTFHGQTIASIVEGKSIVDIMNKMGYDAMVPGNHDFNYGQERLIQLSKMTDFPILCANIEKEDKTTLFTPYTIKEFEGVKVGIFGLSTPETAHMTHPKNVTGLTFKDPVTAAKEMVNELKDKVDVIIAVAHLGLDEYSTYTSKAVAQGVEGIDVIVDGHSHTTLPEGLEVGDTLIVQTGDYDKNLGIVDVIIKDGKASEKNARLFTKEEATTIEENPEIVSLVAAIEAENEKITSVAVGSTDTKLDGEREMVRAGETNLGNLIAAAMLQASSADIALTNGGGIRASIDTGEITKGEVIEVLPFGNYVVVKEVKGADIVGALEHGISSYPEPKGAFPHVAGMTFKFDPSKEAGQRILEVRVKGEPIDANKIYKLATNDFLAAGGDEYTMLAEGDILVELPQLDEIVVDYIQQFGTGDIKVDGRVKAVEITQPVVSEKQEVKTAVDTYVVKAGDVLWKIAKQFDMSFEKLGEYNKLRDPDLIFPGQKILIPQQ
ncbi:5'-nucleotidase C-terminal domain-containing protein [Clostridiaceae bacterium 35-E11]